MFEFDNVTTKDDFKGYIESNKIIIKALDVSGESQKSWDISDVYGNLWRVVFDVNSNMFSVFNNEEPFKVDITMNGSHIEIHAAVFGKRNIKSSRLLKKFMNLSMMINCMYEFDYLT